MGEVAVVLNFQEEHNTLTPHPKERDPCLPIILRPELPGRAPAAVFGQKTAVFQARQLD